jgi:hypothetical protein
MLLHTTRIADGDAPEHPVRAITAISDSSGMAFAQDDHDAAQETDGEHGS